MSKKELQDWCRVRVAMHHRLVYNDDSGYMMQWEDGTTYRHTIRYTDTYGYRYEYKTYINDVLVASGVIE